MLYLNEACHCYGPIPNKTNCAYTEDHNKLWRHLQRKVPEQINKTEETKKIIIMCSIRLIVTVTSFIYINKHRENVLIIHEWVWISFA